MKKLIFVFVIFITAFQFSFSQPYQTVYTANYYITKFFSFKITNNPVKKIFFQEMGLTGDPCPTDPVGFYTFQINKNNFQTYQPCNGFLGRHECTVYTFGCDRHSVDFFRFSNQDSNLVFKYTYYPGAPSPQCAPFKRSKISSNWGMSSTTLFNNQTLYGYDINPVNDNIMYAGVEDNINKSTNRGNSWSVVSALTDLDGIVRINPLRTNYVFAAGTGNMYLSTNGGSSFSSLTAPPFKKIAFNLNDSSVYGITSTGVYKSVNHGMNWSHIASFTFIYTIEINPDNPDIVYIGTFDKVYRTINGGQTFNHSNLSLPNSNKILGISKDAGTGDTIFLCTDKGIYKVWDLQTDIKNITGVLPEKFKLYQNYPNPFNPNTTISFDLPQPSFIKIIIYDILGKEISSLVNRDLNRGSYEINWFAGEFPSGTYFYKLEGLNIDKGKLQFTDTRRMILIK